jgi:hypothetical protein|tara:strand:+ start:5043 stop:5234 length:192 start_codon:yes stop_codon:yes gene_type:complete
MGQADIEYLKVRMRLYILEEEYEKAAELKRWIIDLGGNPELDDIEKVLEKINNKQNEVTKRNT